MFGSQKIWGKMWEKENKEEKWKERLFLYVSSNLRLNIL